MRGPSGSQFLMAVAYWSSIGPSYKFSTLYFWAVAGMANDRSSSQEGHCWQAAMIASLASLAPLTSDPSPLP